MRQFRAWLARTLHYAEVDRLREQIAVLIKERDSLALSAKNSQDRAAEANAKLIEAVGREAEALRESREAIKAVANYAVIAAGSKLPIFDGVGPHLPAPKYTETPAPIRGPMRASAAARMHNGEAMKEFLKQEAALEEQFSQEAAG